MNTSKIIDLPGIEPKKPGNPVYEYIKKEDIENAFKDALIKSFSEMVARIDVLISLYAKTAPSSMWVWDFTSRWGLDFWG